MTSKLIRIALVLAFTLGLASIACGDDARPASTHSPTSPVSTAQWGTEDHDLSVATAGQGDLRVGPGDGFEAARPEAVDYASWGRVDARPTFVLVEELELELTGVHAAVPQTTAPLDVRVVDPTERADLTPRPGVELGLPVVDAPGHPDLGLLAAPELDEPGRFDLQLGVAALHPTVELSLLIPEAPAFDGPEVLDLVRLNVVDYGGECVAGARVDLTLVNGDVLAGLTDREGEVTFDVPATGFPVSVNVHRDDLPGLTVQFTRAAAHADMASYTQLPLVLLPPGVQPWWLHARGSAIHLTHPASMLTVSPTTQGTTYHGFGPSWDVRFEPGHDLLLVAALWTPGVPTGVVTPGGQRLALEGWTVVPVDATKVDVETQLDFADRVVADEVSGVIVLPEWARRAHAAPLNAYITVTSRDSRGALFAGAPVRMARHAVVPGFAYTVEYLQLKGTRQPATVYTLFNGDITSTTRELGYPKRGLVRPDFPRPPAMINAATVRFDEPLVWQLDREELADDEQVQLVAYLRDATGQLVWAAVINPTASHLSLTEAPTSVVNSGVVSFTFPPEAFAHEGGAPVGPWQATVVACTWRGAYDGTCDRQAVGRATTIVPREWTNLDEVLPIDPFLFDHLVPFVDFPSPDPINPAN